MQGDLHAAETTRPGALVQTAGGMSAGSVRLLVELLISSASRFPFQRFGRVPPTVAKILQGLVGRHPMDPGLQPGMTGELPDLAKYPQKDALRQVGCVAQTHQPHHQPVCLRMTRLVQLLLRIAVALLTLGDHCRRKGFVQ